MEKEFVPYELALRMKALGFDEPCFAAYSEDNDVNSLFIYWNDLASRDELFISQNSCEQFEYICLAPTWQSAFRWFRDEHKLHHEIEYNGFEYLGYVSGMTANVFNTYEEAELACLEKLIQIAENGK